MHRKGHQRIGWLQPLYQFSCPPAPLRNGAGREPGTYPIVRRQIKEHTLTHLDHYLELFEANATRPGTYVHWAGDAEEHNTILSCTIQKGSAMTTKMQKKEIAEQFLTALRSRDWDLLRGLLSDESL